MRTYPKGDREKYGTIVLPTKNFGGLGTGGKNQRKRNPEKKKEKERRGGTPGSLQHLSLSCEEDRGVT